MIAVEADWPDCATINDYIHGISIRDPLSNFTRFPIWMWKNEVMGEFTEWMKHWNSSHTSDQVRFYGLDVYSLQKYAKIRNHRSTEEVVKYLQSVDPSAASKAKSLYSCFERFHDDPLMYSLSIKLGLDKVSIVIYSSRDVSMKLHLLCTIYLKSNWKRCGMIRYDQSVNNSSSLLK
jgi:hypothetical protein